MDTLIYRMGATTEDLADLGVGKVLPYGEQEHLPVPQPDPPERLDYFSILSTAYHDLAH